MNNEQVRALLEKYRLGTLSNEERAILESWYLDKVSNADTMLSDEELQRNLQRVGREVVGQTKPRGIGKQLWRAAAVLVAISLVGWYVMRDTAAVPEPRQVATKVDVLPGGNRAKLTLADGRVISLSNAQQGIVVAERRITYMDGTYLARGLWGTGYHHISTPKGGQYRVSLPDGTKVWLNAGSNLRYPAQFSGHIREVELEGEAYFDVTERTSADGSRIPFIVKSEDQEITVLGTEFNVSAYADEPVVKTTLINGKVRVLARKAGNGVLLAPGQEALLSATGIETRKANIATAVAWKEGKFRFNETELHEIMSQLSRWYDLEIEYRGVIPQRHFYGVINRDQTLNEVLDILKEGGVNFKIEKADSANRLLVYP